MDTINAGDLVTVTGTGPALDGIVFDTPSRTKVVVAVVDPHKGPVFRPVHPDALSERAVASPHDTPLRLLIKRTPQPSGGKSGGTGSRVQGRAGFTRGAAHRSTGR